MDWWAGSESNTRPKDFRATRLTPVSALTRRQFLNAPRSAIPRERRLLGHAVTKRLSIASMTRARCFLLRSTETSIKRTSLLDLGIG
jgi:hypothetical protein